MPRGGGGGKRVWNIYPNISDHAFIADFLKIRRVISTAMCENSTVATHGVFIHIPGVAAVTHYEITNTVAAYKFSL